eukprot:14267-Hanusia_phi.AAC.2
MQELGQSFCEDAGVCNVIAASTSFKFTASEEEEEDEGEHSRSLRCGAARRVDVARHAGPWVSLTGSRSPVPSSAEGTSEGSVLDTFLIRNLHWQSLCHGPVPGNSVRLPY